MRSMFLLYPFALLMTWMIGRRSPRRPHVLQGWLSQRLMRMVVMMMVMTGMGKRAEAQTQPATGTTPPKPLGFGGSVVPLTVQGNAAKHVVADGHDVARSKDFPVAEEAQLKNWAYSKTNWHGNPVAGPGLEQFVGSGTEKDKTPNMTIADLQKAAAALTAIGHVESPVVARLWQRTGEVKPAEAEELGALYSTLEDMARADNALILAVAQTTPITYTGWLSKGGPPPNYVPAKGITLPPGLLVAARKIFPTADAGLWESEGVLSFKLPEGNDGPTFTLIRRGQKVALMPGEFVQLRRLDLLVVGPATAPNAAPPVATHRTLGPLRLPYDTVVTARNAGMMLTPEAKEKLKTLMAAGLDGDPDAIHLLEMMLPLAVGELRAAITGDGSKARGAPAIRMLLEEFDGN